MSSSSSESKEAVDEGLYSRQLYVFGHEAQKQMQETNVLVVGLKGLGVEIAKNIILAGVKSVGLLDPEPVALADLGSQFYLRPEHKGKPRAESSVASLAQLNRYVKVHVVKESLESAIKSKQYQVVVVTGRTRQQQLALNQLCRECGSKFISADIRGVLAAVFVDVGPAHTVVDKNGERPLRGPVVNVTQAEDGVVTTHEDHRHGLEDGDLVTFEELEGMVGLNQAAPRKVKVINPFSFSIGDTRSLPPYSGTRGYFNQVKAVTQVSHKPLGEVLQSPGEFVGDYKWNANQLHCLYNAMSAYQEAHEGALPDPTKPKEAQDLVALAEVEAKKAGVELDTALMARMARCCSAELNPMAALAGGVVGQEVLKACTGKFMPISQFFYWDASAVLPEEDLDPQQYAPLPGEEGARYTHQVAVLGRKLHSRLVQGRYFLVGAGAIGCEMLKNWALMGVASDRSRGMVEVTDMDTIEKSNLSRQFLFRTSDIGQLKSECAAKAVRAMNPAIQVHASTVRVGPATEDTYDEKFWVGLDGVITALDNVAARLYVDSRCVYFRKPLIDSGTLGTKGNTQVVVPYKSESYGSTQDPPEESIPLCTLKHFPNKIEHTIQWARDAFEGWFKQGAEEVNNYLSNPSYLSELEQQANTQLTSLETVRDFLLKEKPILFTDCIKYARLQFEREFNHAIKQLLLTFPKDSKDSSGNPFWSGLKRAPTPLVFDAQDPVHMAFIVSAAHLRAFNFGLKSPSSPDLDEFRKVVAAVEVPGFKPKAGVRIAKDDAEAKKMQEEEEQSAGSSEEHEAKVKQVISELPKPSSLAGYRLNAVEFEKDDDTNHHMEFITACSNLRARCYEIKEASMHQTKFIAGKIIPAIATTTAMVTGMVCLELYKLLQLPEGKPLEAFQSCFANLAVPIFQASEPLAPAFTKTPMKKKEGGVWEWSLWDRIDIDLGDCTLQALLDHFLEEFGMEVNMLSYGSSMLYYNFGGVVKKKVKDRLGRPLSKVIQKVAKVSLSDKDKYIVLEACVNDPETMDDLDIPYIRVKLHD